jgi:hypothetical protein
MCFCVACSKVALVSGVVERQPSNQRAKVELWDFDMPQREDPTTEPTISLVELLAKVGDPDSPRRAAKAVVQMLIEAEVSRA